MVTNQTATSLPTPPPPSAQDHREKREYTEMWFGNMVLNLAGIKPLPRKAPCQKLKVHRSTVSAAIVLLSYKLNYNSHFYSLKSFHSYYLIWVILQPNEVGIMTLFNCESWEMWVKLTKILQGVSGPCIWSFIIPNHSHTPHKTTSTSTRKSGGKNAEPRVDPVHL